MPVILARLRAELAGATEPPAVHAYSLPDDLTSASVLRAACGHELKQNEGERVNAFVGAPCTPCLLATTSQSGEVTSECELESIDLNAVDPAGEYAVGLRSERVRHLLPKRRIVGSLDGRSVVQTVCGLMAWGPLTSAPEWPLCSECEAMPSEATS